MPYTATDVRARPRILRMLLCGGAKTGKTCSAVNTSPKPVFVFQTDGRGALDPATDLGGEFTAEDINSMASYKRTFAWLKMNTKDFNTVVFDNITVFATVVEAEVRKDMPNTTNPRDIYPELERRLMDVVNELIHIPQHLIIIGHVEQPKDSAPGNFGHMLGVTGKSKMRICAMVQDWVLLDVSMDGNEVRRDFLLAPQGNWNKAVRSIQNVSRMPANVSAFIDLMNKKKIIKQPIVNNGVVKKPVAAIPQKQVVQQTQINQLQK